MKHNRKVFAKNMTDDELDEELKVLTQESHSRHGAGKFCQLCGAKKETKKVDGKFVCKDGCRKSVILVCEDASHLGGPMGTEYTTHLFSKQFPSIEAAQNYAKEFEENFSEWATWKKSGENNLVCDSGPYIWKITWRKK